ncbi:MAG: hypothetical protein OIF55_18245 [Amphritea sp.]|nr:hypothetical protein [Amphritea sp.]
MTQQAHFILMAAYNSRMNKQLFQAAAQLSESELREDRGAFFGSIIGTKEPANKSGTFSAGR